MTQWFRRALIEQYAHLCRSKCTACGVIEYGANLFGSDTGKPIHELRYQCAVLKILKEGRHWHARASEHPGAADAFGIPFDS